MAAIAAFPDALSITAPPGRTGVNNTAIFEGTCQG